MHPDSGNGGPAVAGGEHVSDADLASALLRRVDELEARLQSIPIASDEKALKELRRTVEALAKRDPKFEEKVTNRVDVVADRMETVAKTVSTTAAGLAAKDGEIAQLRRELETQVARLESALQQVPSGRDDRALTELQRAVARLSDPKLPRDVQSRIDDLVAKIGLLAERVDTVSSTASTAAAGLAGRDGELAALRERLDAEASRVVQELEALRRAIDPAPVAELRQALADLAGRAAASHRASGQSIVELRATAEMLGARVDAIGSAVAAAAARAAESEELLAEVGARVEDEASRHASAMEVMEQTIRTFSVRLDAESERSSEGARALEEGLTDLSATAERLGSRLDSLAATVATTSDAVAEQDVGLAELRRELHDGRERVDGLVRDLMRALEDFPADALPAFEARLDEVAGDVRGLADRLRQAEDDADERAREASAAVERALARLESEVVDARSNAAAAVRTVEQRLEANEEAQQALAADLTYARADSVRAQATSDELAARLDSLAATVATTSDALAAQDLGLEELERELRDGRERVDGLVRDLMRALEDFPGDALPAFEARLDEVAGDVRGLADRLRQAENRTDLDALEARLSAFEAELAATTEGLGRRDSELEALRSELGRRVDSIARDAEADTERADALEARLSALDAELAATTEGLGRRDSELEGLRSELGRRVDSIARVAEEEAARAATQVGEELRRSVDVLATSLATVADEDRERAAAEIARLAAVLEVERASVRGRLEALATALENPSATTGTSELERQLSTLAARFDSLESGGADRAESLDRLSSAFEAERASVQGQLDALADALLTSAQAESGQARAAALEARMSELGRRLHEIERRSEAVASVVSNATTLWPTALRTLEARIDAIAPLAAAPEDVPAPDDVPAAGASSLVTDGDGGLDHGRHEDDDLTPAAVGADVVPLRGGDP